MKITVCVGTRPNLIKAAPLLREMDKYDLEYRFIHTGQHYDPEMDAYLMDDLELPKVDFEIDCGHFDTIDQISQIIHYFAGDCVSFQPDLIIVFGDVTSTLACALVANKMGIKLAHVEAGERSGNKSMPEEMNRILVDQMSDFLFCASNAAVEFLYPDLRGILVGNLMIDQLLYTKENLKDYFIHDEPYAVLTLHRQFNVDDPEKLELLFDKIIPVSEKIRIIFPCHPRTKKRLKEFNLVDKIESSNVSVTIPHQYTDFIGLISNAKFVMTDSGGLQVETSVLDVPCLTLRNETEWRETLTNGTNILLNNFDIKQDVLEYAVDSIIEGKWKNPKSRLYDGKASERIMGILASRFGFERKK